MTTCPRCPATWTGYRAQHCPECHETFTGTASGDMHRVGPYERRRCLGAEDMREKGMTQNSKGQWTTGVTMPRYWEATS